MMYAPKALEAAALFDPRPPTHMRGVSLYLEPWGYTVISLGILLFLLQDNHKEPINILCLLEVEGDYRIDPTQSQDNSMQDVLDRWFQTGLQAGSRFGGGPGVGTLPQRNMEPEKGPFKKDSSL